MRILFSCVGSYGHFFPLVPLARALAASGHDVAFATAEAFAGEVESAGFEHLATGLSQEARNDAARPHLAGLASMAPEERRPVQFTTMFARVAAPANLPDLLAAATSWRPDVIVHETAELAAPIVAATLGVPCVNHGFGRMVPLAILARAGELVAPLWSRAGLDAPRYAGAFRNLYLDPCPPSLQIETPPADRVALVRPLAFDGARDETTPGWLNRLPNRPTIYVTLGTVFNDASVFRVLLEELVRDDVNVVVTTGPTVDPSDIGAQPPNVQVERFVPQSAILERAHVVVSHAGSGSMLAALARALPMVLVPRGADQFDNAEACVRAGVAVRLMPAELTGAAVRAAVARVLSDPSYANVARNVQAEIGTMPAPASAVSVIESLVRH